MDIDSIIFDLDGTLWDSTDVVLRSWNSVLRDINGIEESITKEQLKSVMGLQFHEIGEKFFPDFHDDYALSIMKKCFEAECAALRKQGGKLYPKLEETLYRLSRKFPLFIVSNCNGGYIETFLEYHKLSKYFKDFKCAGETGLPKGESVKSMIRKYKLKHAVYVGDTVSDLDASKTAGIPFIYASYGFGNVKSCDNKIDSFEDLSKLLL